LVVDLTKFNKILPNGLIEILTSGNWIKTGVGIDLDIQYISDNFGLSQANGIVDIKTYALLSGISNPNLEFLSGIEKPETNYNDWSLPITLNNLKYAGSDAFCSYNLGKQFLKISSNVFSNKRINSTENINKISTTLSNETNYVGLLQEYVMKNCTNRTIVELPRYTDFEADKKTHLFAVECKVKQTIGHGIGQNKMTAKQNAAKDVYLKLTAK
jgi:hypothetical protein